MQDLLLHTRLRPEPWLTCKPNLVLSCGPKAASVLKPCVASMPKSISLFGFEYTNWTPICQSLTRIVPATCTQATAVRRYILQCLMYITQRLVELTSDAECSRKQR